MELVRSSSFNRRLLGRVGMTKLASHGCGLLGENSEIGIQNDTLPKFQKNCPAGAVSLHCSERDVPEILDRFSQYVLELFLLAHFTVFPEAQFADLAKAQSRIDPQ